MQLCALCATIYEIPRMSSRVSLDFSIRDGNCERCHCVRNRETQMRSAMAVVSAGAMLAAQIPPGLAQNAVSATARSVTFNPVQDATISAAIVNAFDAFPKGGDLLSKRIAEMIAKDPKLAVGLVKYVQM